MPVAPALRTTRAVVFAAICMALALAGHLTAGHSDVSAWAVGMGFAGTCVVAWVLCCAERSLVTILGGLLGGQFFLHALFNSRPPAGHGAAADPGMSMGAGDPAATLAEHCAHSAVQATTGDSGAAMTLAHLAAALVAAWWLRRGERAVWALARLSARLPARLTRLVSAALRVLLRPARPLAGPVLQGTRRRWPDQARPQVWPLRHCVIGRAPPNGSTMFAL